VATLFGVDQDIVTRPGRYQDTVESRGVLCYWAARELGISTMGLSKRLGISQPTASQSVKRSERKPTQGDGMIYVNKSIPVPHGPAKCWQWRAGLVKTIPL